MAKQIYVYLHEIFGSNIQKDCLFRKKTALKLSCIPASSAFIERFFSLCGIVTSNNKARNLNAETIINRSMLKANMDLLNELRKNKQ